ncbi:MAG: protein kinase [Deltaproteobacteria bacterium]|nr:protein kinase [Deltaproteobacteria bacterium]
MICPSCGRDVPGLEDAAFCSRCGAKLPALSPADPHVGTVIAGRYRIVGVLGEGGMGTVYAAEQALGTETRRVAVKILPKGSQGSPDAVERFRRECGTASKLLHPNAVAIHDFGTTAAGELFIVMELVEGRPLAALVTPGGVAPARVLALFDPISSVVDEAHALGIVHRDLKPENILVAVDRRGREIVKVLDFGIALPARSAGGAAARLTAAGAILGTPPYMAPEQFGGSDVDARADVYALGVIAYELLAGRTPFEATELIDWARQHMSVPPPPLPDTAGGVAIPPAMRTAILRALEKRSGDRPASARAFYDELAAAAAFPPAPLADPGAPASPAATVFAAPDPSSLAAREPPRPASHALPAHFVPNAHPPPHAPAHVDATPPIIPASRWPLWLAASAAAVAAGALAIVVVLRLFDVSASDGGGSDAAAATPTATTSAPPIDLTSEPSTAPLTTPTSVSASSPPAAPPLPPPVRPPASSCAALLAANDCAIVASLKPTCASRDPLHDEAHRHCASLCPSVCPAPHRH